jgi:hypothetical protein
MPAQRSLQLLVLKLTPAIAPADRDCPGIYAATVPAEVSDVIAATAIVDAFFRQHAPHQPEDFLYQVWDGARQLPETTPGVVGVPVTLTRTAAAPQDREEDDVPLHSAPPLP